MVMFLALELQKGLLLLNFTVAAVEGVVQSGFNDLNLVCCGQFVR